MGQLAIWRVNGGYDRLRLEIGLLVILGLASGEGLD